MRNLLVGFAAASFFRSFHICSAILERNNKKMISLIKDGKYDQKSNLLQLLFNFRDIAGSDRGGIIYS